MNLIACCHPGKIGDTLFTLPTVKELCRRHQAKADLYVRDFVEPARDLIEYQPYINQMRTDGTNIEIPGRYQGIIKIPDSGQYKEVFQVSWTTPPRCPLPESFPLELDLPKDIGRDIHYEVPEGLPPKVQEVVKHQEYIVLTTRSQGQMIFRPLFETFIQRSSWPVLVMGGQGEFLSCGLDLTGMGFLDMARTIAHAKAYLGVFSSPLVVAQGFPLPKTCVFDGVTWHPTHILKDGETDYLVNPSVEELLESVGRKLRVQRINLETQ